MFRRLIAQAGLCQPIPQYEVIGPSGFFICRADFAYPEDRLLIELDGYVYHIDRERFQRDRSVQNRVELLGWQMLRYTWDDLVTQPWLVVQQVESVLA